MKTLTKIDKTGYAVLALTFAFALYFGFTDATYFNTVFTVEDGMVEYGTAIMLFLISMLCLYRLWRLWSVTSLFWKTGVFIAATVFFFAAGEEISWGQRMFNIASSHFFLEHNAQAETNLHNLVVDGKKINKIIFSQLLMAVMVLYLIAVPLLYRKVNGFKTLVDAFAVPVVKWHHTIAFMASTLLVAINPPDRKWEVYEFAFGVIFFLIFLNPLNTLIYKKEASEIEV
jgi:hypothetical protein